MQKQQTIRRVLKGNYLGFAYEDVPVRAKINYWENFRGILRIHDPEFLAYLAETKHIWLR